MKKIKKTDTYKDGEKNPSNAGETEWKADEKPLFK